MNINSTEGRSIKNIKGFYCMIHKKEQIGNLGAVSPCLQDKVRFVCNVYVMKTTVVGLGCNLKK